MKRFPPLFAMAALLIASFACKALSSSNVEDEPVIFTQTIPATDTNSDASAGVTDEEIPIPVEAVDIQNFGDTTLFYLAMTIEEGADYYQTEMPTKGYVEETAITVISDSFFSLVFSGHPSGSEVAITGVDLGDGTINITIELQDILKTPADTNGQPPTTLPSVQPNPAGVIDEEIPIPQNAVNLINVADTLMFHVPMTIEEGVNYYQTEMPARGYEEVSAITRVSDDSFTLVFSGHPSGLEVYIAGTDDGDGTINIAIELRDILK